MKAFSYQNYGGPEELKLIDLPLPEPKAGEVRIKLKATALNSGDHRMLRANPFLVRLNNGLFKPKIKILGADIAGVIDAIGPAGSHFKISDEVFGSVFSCGFGGFAEYVCAPESVLCLKPATLSFESAAALPTAGATALLALGASPEDYRGKKVLIYGASGGVGLFAVQIAKHFGATITAVCSSRHIDTIKSFNVDKVVDYSKDDFRSLGKDFDLILAINGYNHIKKYQSLLAPKGKYLMIGGENKQIFEALVQGAFRTLGTKQKMNALTIAPSNQHYQLLANLLVQHKIEVIIDRSFELDQLVEAFKYFEAGHAKGKIVIRI